MSTRSGSSEKNSHLIYDLNLFTAISKNISEIFHNPPQKKLQLFYIL